MSEESKEPAKEKKVQAKPNEPIKEEKVQEVPILEAGPFCKLLTTAGYACKPAGISADNVEIIEVQPDELYNVALTLKENNTCAFDFLVSVSGVDRQETLESVYHLLSYKHLHKVILKVPVPKEEGKAIVPSVTNIWSTADWHERETFDLYGIKYAGHPDLKRILLPNDWIGYPLRKDYTNTDPRLVWNER